MSPEVWLVPINIGDITCVIPFHHPTHSLSTKLQHLSILPKPPRHILSWVVNRLVPSYVCLFVQAYVLYSTGRLVLIGIKPTIEKKIMNNRMCDSSESSGTTRPTRFPCPPAVISFSQSEIQNMSSDRISRMLQWGSSILTAVVILAQLSTTVSSAFIRPLKIPLFLSCHGTLRPTICTEKPMMPSTVILHSSAGGSSWIPVPFDFSHFQDHNRVANVMDSQTAWTMG